MKRSLLLVLSMLVLVMSLISSASASYATEENLDVSIDRLMNHASEFEEVNISDEKVLSNFARRDFKQGLIELNSKAELDFEEAFVAKIKDSGDYAVRVPIIHENYEVLSGITAVYDNNKNFKYFLETIIYEDNGVGHLKIWKNDELQQDHSLEIAQLEENTNEAAVRSYSCLSGCLSDQGLPMWVLGIVSVGCAALCGATAGAGCVICIEALGLGYIGIFDYCFKKCI